MAVVTAWCSEHEFVRVAKNILGGTVQGWRSASRAMNVWKLRVDRLPAGVETSMSLVEAQLTLHDSPQAGSLSLTLAAAINRFLNLISHLSERKFGLTKYHEAAAKFGIPGWVVDLRHETTHGDMPKLNSLVEGLDFSVRWLAANYWQQEMEAAEKYLAEGQSHDPLKSSDVFTKLHRLLDCYGYLKIYSLWGTKTVGELSDQTELYGHISTLWENFQQNRREKKKRKISIDSIHVNEALSMVNEELAGYLTGGIYKGDREYLDKVLVKALLEEELLLPGEEFLASITEESEKLIKVKERLPATLINMWTDLLKLLADEKIISDLMVGLYDVARDEEGDRLQRDLACGWIVELCRRYTVRPAPPSKATKEKKQFGGKKKKNARQNSSVMPPSGVSDGTVVEMDPKLCQFSHHCLNHPSEALFFLLPQILQLRTPKLAKANELSLRNLLETFLGHKTSSVITNAENLGEDFTPYTVASFHAGEDTKAKVDDSNPWREVKDSWSLLPIGLASNQSLESLDLDLCRESPDKVATGDLKCLVDFSRPSELISVGKIDWQCLLLLHSSDYSTETITTEEEAVPAFYRNAEAKRSTSGSKGKKRRR